MPWMIPAAIVGGAAITAGASYLSSSKSASDTSREASRRQLELGKNQALINNQNLSPFIGSGMLALQELYGYTPVSGDEQYRYVNQGGDSTGTGVNVSGLATSGSNWKSPTYIGSQAYAKTGEGVDPTGGAGQYKTELDAIIKGASTPGVTTQGLMDRLDQYGQNFRFNENDPAYQYKTEQAETAINRQLAARGSYNSRVGLNMLSDSNRAIMADEYEKQYGRGYQTISDLFKMGTTQDAANLSRNQIDYQRQYGGVMDLFNMSSNLGQQKYNSLLDAVKIGTGSGTAAGNLGNQAVGNLNSAYGQMAQSAQVAAGQQADLYAGLGAMPMNYMILQQMLSGRNNAQSAGVNNSNAFLNYGTNAGQYESPWY